MMQYDNSTLTGLIATGLIASVCFVCAVHPVCAQGSLDDYQRAAALRKLTQDKVFPGRVDPHWIGKTGKFWYRSKLAPDKHQFILVDATTGERSVAFDHRRLAEQLAGAVEHDVDRESLPLSRLAFAPDEDVVRFTYDKRRWSFDFAADKLAKINGDSESNATIEPLPRPRRSRRTGEETNIRFVNQTEKPLRIFWIDERGGRIAYGEVAANQQRRQHTFAGHVWLLTNGDSQPRAAFEATAEPADALVESTTPWIELRRPARRSSNAQSPDGAWEAFIKNHNVFLRDRNSGEEFALSDNGSPADAYQRRFAWSPDAKKLVAVQETPGEKRQIHFVESAPSAGGQPKLHTLDYAKPGDQMPVRRPRLFDVKERRLISISEELFPNAWSISDVRWQANSQRFTFLYNQRGHQVLRVVVVDADTGEAAALIDEQSETFVDYAGKSFSRYLDETNEIIWMSERDGWNHLYMYDAKTGRVKNQITTGQWVVREVDRVDEQARQVWFRAGGIYPEQDPYYVHFCRIDFDGTNLVVLTSGNGMHEVEFSPDDKYLVDTYSRIDLPPVAELRRTADGSLVCELEQSDWSQLLATGWRPPERFVAKGRDDVTNIYGVIFRPTDVEPGRKYPVVEQIYAGPQSAYVPKRFESFFSAQALAELGFIVVQIDGMGTSHRSKEFHDVCWKNLADAGFPDRIRWMRAAAAEYPEMDLSRVGIYGGSAGGQNALGGLLQHGDFYKAGVADCGCHDNRMDKIWWNELWMGYPIGPHYKQQSNVTQAHRLEGKLLLTVGELDRNVDPASTMQVVDALIKADKDFELLIIPGAGHGAGGSPYGTRRRNDFFVRNLLGVEPRWSAKDQDETADAQDEQSPAAG